MAKEDGNYLSSIKEHRLQCLDRFANKMLSEHLTEDDYLAIERLLQVLIEGSIGVAKQYLKLHGYPPSSTAYDNFQTLAEHFFKDLDLKTWKGIIGLRNVLVHDYLNIDREVLKAVLRKRSYQEVSEFISACT